MGSEDAVVVVAIVTKEARVAVEVKVEVEVEAGAGAGVVTDVALRVERERNDAPLENMKGASLTDRGAPTTATGRSGKVSSLVRIRGPFLVPHLVLVPHLALVPHLILPHKSLTDRYPQKLGYHLRESRSQKSLIAITLLNPSSLAHGWQKQRGFTSQI